jgi:hypothetical protein
MLSIDSILKLTFPSPEWMGIVCNSISYYDFILVFRIDFFALFLAKFQAPSSFEFSRNWFNSIGVCVSSQFDWKGELLWETHESVLASVGESTEGKDLSRRFYDEFQDDISIRSCTITSRYDLFALLSLIPYFIFLLTFLFNFLFVFPLFFIHFLSDRFLNFLNF